jgi:transcriptional regulator with XRE-family HTH domain
MAAMKDRLYEERKKHGLSQEDVARRLDVSAKAVSKWETGESQPTLDNMAKLSDLYQQSVDYLLGKEATPSVSATGPVPSPAAKPQRFGFFFLPLVMSLLAIALFILYSPVFAIIHVTSGVGGLTGDLGTTSFDSYHLFLGSSDWFIRVFFAADLVLESFLVLWGIGLSLFIPIRKWAPTRWISLSAAGLAALFVTLSYGLLLPGLSHPSVSTYASFTLTATPVYSLGLLIAILCLIWARVLYLLVLILRLARTAKKAASPKA